MLDSDLAKLYEIKTIRLREQIKKNIKRFPDDFMFKLTENETKIMVSQNAIPSIKHLGGHLPYVFTEQGVTALSGVLKSKKAIKINIQIVRAFVSMRKFISQNALLFDKLNNVDKKLLEHDKNFEKVFNAIEDKTLRKEYGIFSDGQVYDAHKFVSDLIKSAKERIILIRHGKDVAGIISIDDLNLLEKLEDRLDLQDAIEILEDEHSKFVDWDDVKDTI